MGPHRFDAVLDAHVRQRVVATQHSHPVAQRVNVVVFLAARLALFGSLRFSAALLAALFALRRIRVARLRAALPHVIDDLLAAALVDQLLQTIIGDRVAFQVQLCNEINDFILTI